MSLYLASKVGPYPARRSGAGRNPGLGPCRPFRSKMPHSVGADSALRPCTPPTLTLPSSGGGNWSCWIPVREGLATPSRSFRRNDEHGGPRFHPFPFRLYSRVGPAVTM